MNIHTCADSNHYLILVIDWATGNISTDELYHDDNGTPAVEYYGYETAYCIPTAITEEDYKALSEKLKPLIERVVAGYENRWNDNYVVATFTADAEEATDTIENIIAGWKWEDVLVYEAEDYVGCVLTAYDAVGNECRFDQALYFSLSVGAEKLIIDHETGLGEIEKKIRADMPEGMVVRRVDRYLERLQEMCLENFMAIEKEIANHTLPVIGESR